MSRQTVLLGTLTLILLLAGCIFSYQMKPADLPPGIASANWVPLSENSGVLLTRNRKFLGSPDDLHGTLYVKVENVWHRFYFDPAPVAIMPLR